MVEWKIGNDIANAYDEGYEQGKNDAVKHGHWIYGREIAREYLANECVAIEYEDISCSACKTRFRPFFGNFNFCPYCGARMDEDG